MTYEEFDKRCDELENAHCRSARSSLPMYWPGRPKKTDVRMMAYFRYALLLYRGGRLPHRAGNSGTVHHRLQKLPVPPGDHRLLQPRRRGGLLCAGVRTVPLTFARALKLRGTQRGSCRYAYEYNNLAVTYVRQRTARRRGGHPRGREKHARLR